jgi:hypothetical protein
MAAKGRAPTGRTASARLRCCGFAETPRVALSPRLASEPPALRAKTEDIYEQVLRIIPIDMKLSIAFASFQFTRLNNLYIIRKKHYNPVICISPESQSRQHEQHGHQIGVYPPDSSLDCLLSISKAEQCARNECKHTKHGRPCRRK